MFLYKTIWVFFTTSWIYIGCKNIENDNFTILFTRNFSHGKFYLTSLLEQGKNILLKESGNQIETGEVILFSQNEVKQFLEENFEFKILDDYYIIGLYEIIGKKNE